MEEPNAIRENENSPNIDSDVMAVVNRLCDDVVLNEEQESFVTHEYKGLTIKVMGILLSIDYLSF
jgi:hypothetical protein